MEGGRCREKPTSNTTVGGEMGWWRARCRKLMIGEKMKEVGDENGEGGTWVLFYK